MRAERIYNSAHALTTQERVATMAPETRTRLRVTDFGPIIDADVDLRPFTVLIGPSNTGKSLLSALIYALHRCHRGLPWGRTDLLDQQEADLRKQWIAQATESLRNPAQAQRPAPFAETDALLASVQRDFIAAPVAADFADELRRCFGVPSVARLIRKTGPDVSRVSLSTHDDDGDRDARLSVELRDEVSVRSEPPERPLLGTLRPHVLVSSRQHRLAIAEMVAQLANALFGVLANTVYYLPADRTGTMHAHRLLVRSLIRRASRAGLDAQQAVPALPAVVGDFVEALIDMQDRDRGESSQPIREVADQLENAVLAGALNVHRVQAGYPEFSYRPEGWDDSLPLANASSMVSEVAPIILFLRYVVSPGDTLIVEEPEAHVHPAMQVALVRHLAAAVHAGVRVLLTTHSEWVLETLANLVRMSAIPEGKRETLEGGGLALTPEHVGAWLFKPSKDKAGSFVEEVALNVHSGTFPAGFGEVTDALYDDWAHISNLADAQ